MWLAWVRSPRFKIPARTQLSSAREWCLALCGQLGHPDLIRRDLSFLLWFSVDLSYSLVPILMGGGSAWFLRVQSGTSFWQAGICGVGLTPQHRTCDQTWALHYLSSEHVVICPHLATASPPSSAHPSQLVCDEDLIICGPSHDTWHVLWCEVWHVQYGDVMWALSEIHGAMDMTPGLCNNSADLMPSLVTLWHCDWAVSGSLWLTNMCGLGWSNYGQ